MPRITEKPLRVVETEQYKLILGDCREIDWRKENGAVLLTDPPYGISHPTNYRERGRGFNPNFPTARAKNYAPVVSDDEDFDPEWLLNLNMPLCLWGANYYADKLPPMSGWLVWDKERVEELSQATCELAWTNFIKGVRRFKYLWNGMMKAGEPENIHPMQKPIALAQWVLSLSVGVGVACMRLGRRYVGCEIIEEYFNTALERIDRERISPQTITSKGKEKNWKTLERMLKK